MINYDNVKPEVLYKDKIHFNESKIIHFIPDFTTNLIQYFDSEFVLDESKLDLVITNIIPVKIGMETINNKHYYELLKKRFKVNTFIKNIISNKYYIIDYSNILNNSNNILVKLNSFFDYLKNNIQLYKQKFSLVENIILFSFKNKGLFDILKNKIINYDIFIDKHIIASASNNFIIIGYYNSDKVISKNALLKLESIVNNIIDEDIDKIERERDLISLNIISSEKRNAISDKSFSEKEASSEIINNTIENNNIKNEAVLNNINIALDKKIGIQDDRDKLNQTVLKVINKTMYNKEKPSEEDLNDPENLLDKVNTFTEYKEPVILNTEKYKSSVFISPNKNIIKLENFTGHIRHKYEFSSNIHNHIETLFKELETKSLPIKVVNISHEVKDDNSSRFIEYTITLQNLASDYKEPYDIKLRVPAIINDRYFKLNGKEYILSSQQFLKPLTKSSPNEARFLSHFNLVTERLVNFKYSPSETNEIMNYINRKYSKYVEKYSNNYIKFKSGVEIDLNNDIVYNNPKENEILKFEEGVYNYYKDNKILEPNVKKTEFLYYKLAKELDNINPNDQLKATIKNIQYVEIFILGKKIPLIIVLWQQLGLINALIKLGIDNQISDEPIENAKNFKLADNKYLAIFPKNKKEEYIINGLYKIEGLFNDIDSKNINNKNSCENILTNLYGTSIINNLNNMFEIGIDPFTKHILKIERNSTNIIDILSGNLLDKLMNDPVDHPSDLSTMRVRLSEYMVHIIYNELAMAYKTYKDKLAYDKNSKMFFDEKYIIKNLLNQHVHSDATGSSLIDFTNPYSPIDELNKSAKVVRTGKGGVPSKQAFKKSHRTIHKSYIGNIAAHSTPESTDIGLINHHTLGAFISNQTGMYGFRLINNGWETLGIDEALIPFQSSMDSDRLIIARTHMGQKLPIINGEPPLIQSGAEYLVSKIVSNKFVIKAKNNGKVIKVVKDKYITVEYIDGTKESYEITPRISTTKRNSIVYLTLDTLKEGDTFEKDNLIAWNKAFDNEILAIGKTKKVAIMNYLGKSHEDGYVITEDFQNDFVTELCIKIPVLIPPETKLLYFIDKKETKLNDSLIKFQYETKDVDLYLDNVLSPENFEEAGIEDTESDKIENLYNFKDNVFDIRSPGGEIVNIKIKLNTTVKMDTILLNKWKEQNKQIKEIQKNLNKDLIDNLDTSIMKIGIHKHKGNEFQGALIEFYISNQKKINYGDKMANRFGAKGVVNHIIKKEDIPKGEYSGNIDLFLAPSAILGRKNTVIIKEAYLGKIMYNLKSKVKEKLESSGLEACKEMLLKVYELLSPVNDYINYIKELNEKDLKEKLDNPKFNFNLIIPPFTNVTFKNIKLAAEYLKIPLDEKVFIPVLNIWTEPVPVGYAYFSAMEQLASDYESTRATAGYNPITGQPLKRKSKIGGQSLGNLDVYNLLTFNINSVMKEFFTARSDNIKAKNEMISNIIKNGKTNMPEEISTGKTQKLFKILMISIGLYIRD